MMILQEYKKSIGNTLDELMCITLHIEQALYKQDRIADSNSDSLYIMPLDEFLDEILNQAQQVSEIVNAICSYVFNEGELDREQPAEYPDTISNLNYKTAQLQEILDEIYLNLEDLAIKFNCRPTTESLSIEEGDSYEIKLQKIVNTLVGCDDFAHNIYGIVMNDNGN